MANDRGPNTRSFGQKAMKNAKHEAMKTSVWDGEDLSFHQEFVKSRCQVGPTSLYRLHVYGETRMKHAKRKTRRIE